MAYKFFGGRGAVICDHCKVMFDSDISYKEYEEIYNGKNGDDGDFCWRCKSGNKITVKTRKHHTSINGKFHE